MQNSVSGVFHKEIYPNATIGGAIDIFENIWPNPEETIDLLENQASIPESGFSWNRAETIGSGINQDYRTNYTANISYIARSNSNDICSNIHNQFYFMLMSSAIPYAKKHGIDQLIHEDYSILRYSGGQSYSAHSDGSTYTARSVSAICYLNNDYLGGEIEFVNFGIKIKPDPGMLILFPSNYAYSHIAHPVTSGIKYALVTWLKDR